MLLPVFQTAYRVLPIPAKLTLPLMALVVTKLGVVPKLPIPEAPIGALNSPRLLQVAVELDAV